MCISISGSKFLKSENAKSKNLIAREIQIAPELENIANNRTFAVSF